MEPQTRGHSFLGLFGSCGENGPSALSLPEAIQVPALSRPRSRAMPRPQNHTRLHKEKEGLLDVASDTAMAVKSRGVSFSGKRQSNRKRSGKRQSLEALYTKMKRREILVCHSQLSRMAASIIELASILAGDSDQLINWFHTRSLIAQQQVCPACSHTMELQSRSDITDKYR